MSNSSSGRRQQFCRINPSYTLNVLLRSKFHKHRKFSFNLSSKCRLNSNFNSHLYLRWLDVCLFVCLFLFFECLEVQLPLLIADSMLNIPVPGFWNNGPSKYSGKKKRYFSVNLFSNNSSFNCILQF